MPLVTRLTLATTTLLVAVTLAAQEPSARSATSGSGCDAVALRIALTTNPASDWCSIAAAEWFLREGASDDTV